MSAYHSSVFVVLKNQVDLLSLFIADLREKASGWATWWGLQDDSYEQGSSLASPDLSPPRFYPLSLNCNIF